MGADYVDVAREPEQSGGGIFALVKVMQSGENERPPFAPPFLKAGKHFISHTPAILLYLGECHQLAPSSEVGKIWAHQLQLTYSDLSLFQIVAGLRYAFPKAMQELEKNHPRCVAAGH